MELHSQAQRGLGGGGSGQEREAATAEAGYTWNARPPVNEVRRPIIDLNKDVMAVQRPHCTLACAWAGLLVSLYVVLDLIYACGVCTIGRQWWSLPGFCLPFQSPGSQPHARLGALRARCPRGTEEEGAWEEKGSRGT